LGRADRHVAGSEDTARICAELDVPCHASDVNADPQLQAEYADRVR
jgi:hypothetical protein